jgi:anti-sigma B factor antagonist
VDGDTFHIDITTEGGRATVVPVGEVDLGSAAALRGALVEAAGNSDEVVVDLSRVTFIDSMGLSVLIQAKQRQEVDGSSFTIVNPSDRIRYVLELAGVVDYLSA